MFENDPETVRTQSRREDWGGLSALASLPPSILPCLDPSIPPLVHPSIHLWLGASCLHSWRSHWEEEEEEKEKKEELEPLGE